MSDSILAKIKKLLALAADPGAAPNEAETARRQAEALMAKHRIEEAEVLLASGTAKPVFELVTVRMSATPHYPGHTPKQIPEWINLLSYGVAVFTEIRLSLVTTGYYGAQLKLMGTVADVALAQWMIETLAKQAYEAARKAVAGNGTREANQFRRGYAVAVQQRLRAMAQGTKQQAAGSTALVVVDSAKQQALDEAFGQHKSKQMHVDYSQLGYKAGQQAHLGAHRPVAGDSSLRLGA